MEIEKIHRAFDCHKNYHSWELSANGIAGKWLRGKKCIHCHKFVELAEIKGEDNAG